MPSRSGPTRKSKGTDRETQRAGHDPPLQHPGSPPQGGIWLALRSVRAWRQAMPKRSRAALPSVDEASKWQPVGLANRPAAAAKPAYCSARERNRESSTANTSSRSQGNCGEPPRRGNSSTRPKTLKQLPTPAWAHLHRTVARGAGEQEARQDAVGCVQRLQVRRLTKKPPGGRREPQRTALLPPPTAHLMLGQHHKRVQRRGLARAPPSHARARQRA